MWTIFFFFKIRLNTFIRERQLCKSLQAVVTPSGHSRRQGLALIPQTCFSNLPELQNTKDTWNSCHFAQNTFKEKVHMTILERILYTEQNGQNPFLWGFKIRFHLFQTIFVDITAVNILARIKREIIGRGLCKTLIWRKAAAEWD